MIFPGNEPRSGLLPAARLPPERVNSRAPVDGHHNLRNGGLFVSFFNGDILRIGSTRAGGSSTIYPVDVGSLSEPERALWKAFPHGDLVNLGSARGSAHVVRAAVVSALLLGAVPGESGEIAAVRLEGARVTGTLSLGHSVIEVPVRLLRCEFDSVIDMPGARMRDFVLDGSRLAGLSAPQAEIAGNLNLVGCVCRDRVVLSGAHVTGAFRMQRSLLDNPGHVALLANRLVVDDDFLAQEAIVNGEVRLAGARVGGVIGLDKAVIRGGGRRAVNAFSLSVGLSLWARSGFTAEGEVALSNADIGQNLDFRGATLSNPGGDAVIARGIRVGGYMSFADECSAHGAVRLSRATVGGEIYFSGSRFVNPGDDAIRCRHADAKLLGLHNGMATDGIADFRFSRFVIIRDDPACWPRQLRLSGLAYDALDPQLPAARRIAWLLRDTDGYLPGNYETLAAMYRAHGDDASARKVLHARERQHRGQLAWYGRAWSWLQEATVGYGYRPLRAAAWLAGFLGLGTLIFGLHHPPALGGGPHPAFNPLIYTLDLLIPVVNFGLRDAYDPQGVQSWLAYLLIAVGWLFVTTIAAGIARVLRRQ
jgi:hypothetical protein